MCNTVVWQRKSYIRVFAISVQAIIMIKKTMLLLVAAVMVVAVLTAGCTFNVGTTSPSPSPSASPTVTYNSTKGFSMKYPSNWTREEPTNGSIVVLFSVPTNNNSENLNVQVYNASAGDTLSSLTPDILAGIHNISNFTQIQAGNATLAGSPAYKVVYTASDDNGDFLKVTQIWTIYEGKEYLITYKAAPNNYDTYANTAQQMIDSFTTK